MIHSGTIPPKKLRHPGHPGHAAPHHGHSSVVWGVILGVIALAIVGIFVVRSRAPAGPTAAQFVEQMERAAQGDAAPSHLFGGGLAVAMNGGRATVTAENVPSKVCVLAGWPLSRKGIVSINGVTPARISAAGLATICNREGTSATLSWTPRE